MRIYFICKVTHTGSKQPLSEKRTLSAYYHQSHCVNIAGLAILQHYFVEYTVYISRYNVVGAYACVVRFI